MIPERCAANALWIVYIGNSTAHRMSWVSYRNFKMNQSDVLCLCEIWLTVISNCQRWELGSLSHNDRHWCCISIDSVVSSGNDLFDPIKWHRFNFLFQFTYNLVQLCCFVQRRRRRNKQNRSTIFLKTTMNQDKRFVPRGICTRMFRFSGQQNRLL